MRRVSTRVLPEPAPARIASGAARLVTASRWVASRPSRSASTAARYRRGVTRNGVRPPSGSSPEQQKAPSSLRCVAARISSGPFPPTSSDSSPQGCPRCSASAVGLRFPRFPGVVPFRSVTAPDPAPIRLPGLPVRSARAPDLRRLARASGRSFPAPDRCSPAFATYRRACANARGISRVARILFAPVVEVSRCEFERMVGDALDAIPPTSSATQLENVAVMVEDWPTPEQLARSAARHAARPLRGSAAHARADRSATPASRPIASRSSSGPLCTARARRGRARGAGAGRPCCTRSATTSA